ncbi:MAG: IS110 family transposase [Bacteroidota bacterium]
MKSESTKLRDFSGQNIYVGMDVHHKSWKVHIYSDEFELKSLSQEPDVNRLYNYLDSHYKNANYHLAYEAGFSGFWIQRAFAAKGINCKVVHPADVPTSNLEQLRKSDAVDSKKIAKGLRSGDLNFIHVPDIQLEMDRQLMRSRGLLIKDSTRIKNRIKSILKLQGIAIPAQYKEGTWSKVFIKWLGEINFGSVSGKMTMQTHINELLFLEEQKKQVDIGIKELSKTVRYRSNLKLLQSIPSIGLLTGMILLTEIGDMARFSRLDELCSYCGIVPNCHSSGENERIGRLTRRGNSIIKRVLIECAWVAVKKDPALLLYYKEQIVKMKGQKAIIKVVRKLLSRIRYVLMNKQEYVLGVIA